jgi:hypothetical protein
MGIRALYPPPKTTILNKENKKYLYWNMGMYIQKVIVL